MASNKNFTYINFLIAMIALTLGFINWNNGRQQPENIDKLILTKYVVEAEIGQSGKTHFFILNGAKYSANDETYFRDKIIVETIEASLRQYGISYYKAHLPCLEVKCRTAFIQFAEVVRKIKPETILLSADSAGLNSESMLDIFKKDSIPVLTYGNDLAIDYEYFVGVNNKVIGQKLGKYISRKIKSNEKALILHTLKGVKIDPSDNGLARLQAVIDQLPESQVTESSATFWSQNKAYSETKKGLQDNDLKWVVAPSLETAQGAIKAIAELGLTGEVKVTALDFVPEIRKLLELGAIDAAVSHDYEKQGLFLADIIVNQKFVKGTRERPKMLFAGDVVTSKTLFRYRTPEGLDVY